jgi:type II secretory pathway component GspD/PulD (secretin)
MIGRKKHAMRAHTLTVLLAALGVSGGVDHVSGQDPGVRRPGMAGQQAAQQEGITFNFQGLDLASVITAMGQAAGLNVMSTNMPEVLVDYRNPNPMTPQEVDALIRTLAQSHGVTISELPGVLLLEGPLVQEGELVEPRQLFIHRLQHANAMVLSGTLQALFGGSVPMGSGARQASQTLSQQLQAMELQSAQSIQGTQTGAQGQVTFVTAPGELEGDVQIVPDEVTNSLLVRATSGDWAIIQEAILSLNAGSPRLQTAAQPTITTIVWMFRPVFCLCFVLHMLLPWMFSGPGTSMWGSLSRHCPPPGM